MNESAKRALEVAKAGDHSICIIGNDEATDLASSYAKAIPFAPCPCGNYGDRSKECACTPSEIRAHQKRLPKTDIYVEVPRPAFEEWLTEAKPRISRQCVEFFEQAYKKLGLTSRQASAVLRVAATVAKLDHKEAIELQHLAEALQYRSRG